MAKNIDQSSKYKLQEKSEYLRMLEKRSLTNRLMVDGIHSNNLIQEVFNKNE